MKLTTGLFALVISMGIAAPAVRAAEGDKAPAAEKPTKAATKDTTKDTTKAAKKAPGEVTLKGDMVCAKCALHEADTCQGVLKVKEEGKDVKYYLADNAVAHDNHGKVCGGSSPATVKGKVSEAGGKKVLTATEIKFE